MATDSWIVASLGKERVEDATTEAARRRLQKTLKLNESKQLSDDQLRFIANGLEIRVFDLLDDGNPEELCSAAAEVFQVARVLPLTDKPLEAAAELVRLGCLGVLGERGADVRRFLLDTDLPVLPIAAPDWGVRVWATILDVWLHLLRKKGWEDLDTVQGRVASMRSEQSNFEPQFLSKAEEHKDTRPAWELISAYHLAKAAEIVGVYQCQGSVDGHYAIREQLEAQFDRAISAAGRGQLLERETLARLLARTARPLVDNSIWAVTRGANSRVTTFVESMTSRQRKQSIFEMLPPQRRTLRDEGLLGAGYRSVVVSLPTSSGKTFIAEFRILQALNQFDQDRG